MRHRTWSIRWRISLYFLLFTALFILILWLCQIVFLDRIYGFIKTSEIKSAARELTALAGDEEKMKSEAERRSAVSNICVLIFRIGEDGSAENIVSCEIARTCVIHNISPFSIRYLYEMAESEGGTSVNRYRLDPDTHTYSIPDADVPGGEGMESIVYSIVPAASEMGGYLILLDSVITPVDATVHTLNIILAVLSVVMVIVAVVLSLVMSARIGKPVSDINVTARNLAKGNYNIVFPSSSYKEMNELSETLNIAAEELSKVDMLKKELISNTSHDLRTPLTMISGYAEIMRDLPGENTPENAQIIIDETRRLSTLVSDMLDISRLESGAMPVNPETFNLTEALVGTMDRYSSFKGADGYVLNFYADGEVTVTTDRSKFLQAFCNLVNNAITYTGDDKRVDVRQEVYTDGAGTKWARVSVSDTGEGIPADKLSLIWERYYKIDSPHRRSAQGSGLGLSIVGGIMKLLDGRCEVTSSVGEGSTFSIEIKV